MGSDRRDHVGLAVLALSLGTFLVTFDGAAVEMVLPVLRSDLHEPIAMIQWLMTAYLLIGTIGLLPAGRAGDVAGRTRPWQHGIALFIAGSAAAAISPGFWWLLGARVVQSVGSALVAANAVALVVEVVPEAWRGRALAASNVAAAAGLVAGPPLGGLLASQVTWRGIFVVSVVVGAATWWLGRRSLPRQEASRLHLRDLRLGESALAGAGIGGLLLGATLGADGGWVRVSTLVLLVAGGALLVAFATWERRNPRPLLDRELLGRRVILSGLGASFAGYAALFTLTFAMPFFLVMAQGHAVSRAGVLVGAVPLGLVIAAPVGGWIFDRIGSRMPATGGLVIVTGSLVLLSFTGARSPAWFIAVGLCLAGLGLGLFEAPNDAAVLGCVPEARMSIMTATLGTARQLGMTIGVALAATIFAHLIPGVAETTTLGAVGGHGNAHAATVGLRWSMVAGAGLGLAGAVSAFLRQPASPQSTGAQPAPAGSA